MSDQSEDRPLGRFPTIDPAFVARAAGQTWSLVVGEAFDLTPRMRRVRFGGPDLAALDWRPGQDLLLSLPRADGTIARRHYTIRMLRDGALDIDFVLHGDSPAVNWARHARPGETISAYGPRGRTRIDANARRHWFVGDETGLPAIFAMAETLDAGEEAVVILAVHDARERQALRTGAELDLRWFEGPGAGEAALDFLKAHPPKPIDSHAYLLGETSEIRALRHFFNAHGFGRERITSEGYWRPGRIGGHDHV